MTQIGIVSRQLYCAEQFWVDRCKGEQNEQLDDGVEDSHVNLRASSDIHEAERQVACERKQLEYPEVDPVVLLLFLESSDLVFNWLLLQLALCVDQVLNLVPFE